MEVKPAPSVPCTYIRGGTSKALFFHERDLPPPGPVRDQFIIRTMGSPDPSQIDGMGGTRVVTSKAAIVRPSKREDADVDYIFAQIGLGESTVSYDGNCGNISSGVGPFAINEEVLKTENYDSDGNRIVRIFNTGMKAILVAHVPIDKKTGRALEKGDCAISGCPGTGAPIMMDYSRTATKENLQPTGTVVEKLDCTFGPVEASFAAVGNMIVLIKAEALGATGSETFAELDADKKLIAKVDEVRGRYSQKLGRCSDWTKVDEESPMLPMVALISKATSAEGHVQGRLFLDHHPHPAMAGTAGVCITSQSRVEGSIVHQLLKPGALDAECLNIQHPAGHLPIAVKTSSPVSKDIPSFEVLGFKRTARYLMQGNLFVPTDIQDSYFGSQEEPRSSSPQPAKLAQDEQAVSHPANQAASSTKPEDVSVTKRLAAFTHDVTFDKLPKEGIERLRQCLLDFIGVSALGASVAESSPVFLKGIESITADANGTHTIFGSSKKLPAQYAALLNGAYAHTLDFDDTHSKGVVHVGADVVATLLTESENHKNLSYQDLLMAMAVGYEVATRISCALAENAWHRGFHPTSVAGIYGAVAVLARLRKLSITEIENAFGLACSFASGSMQYLENGAWNKRLHPAKAAHDAFIIVAMAQAGVLGASKPIEGKLGLIHAHTDAPYAEVDVSGLSQRWEFIHTALKPYPGCRVTHGPLELAKIISEQNKSREVDHINIYLDPSSHPIVADPTPNKIHPQDVVDAQFSAYYQAAAAWIHGDNLGWAVYDHIHDQDIQDLCSKITIEPKPLPYPLYTEMVATFKDGHKQEMKLERPKWEEPERPPRNEEVDQKFLSLATPVIGTEKSEQIVAFVQGKLDVDASGLMKILG